jgi:hypothetical protein
MCILAELDTQRKALLKKGEKVLSHMVKLLFEEVMAGRFSPLLTRHPKRRRSALVCFGSWWSSWPPRFVVQKDGRWTCVSSHYSRQISPHQMKP